MTPRDDIPTEVQSYCVENSLGSIISSIALKGGVQSHVRRLFTDKNQTLILKQHPQAPSDWYALEAEGLKRLEIPECPRVPKVLSVGSAFLLLEDLTDPSRSNEELTDRYWISFGHQLARLHLYSDATHGLDHDNYLGLMPQSNKQFKDAREFYVENRVLRYLREPLCQTILTREDRAGVDRLCNRILTQFPDQPASFCHGDLWTGNMLIDRDGAPAYIDPAIHYGPAEAELSLTRQFGGVPDSFYAAYSEVNPLIDGWQDRLRIYELKETLALIAQFGEKFNMLEPLRDLIRRFG